jgi:hypothetical protein
LAYFPGAFLWFIAIAFLTRAVEGRPVIWPIVGTLVVGGGLLSGLAWASRLRFTDSAIYVRFFSFRGTTMLWESIATTTYGISYPSLGIGITLRDTEGRKVIIHFNFWDREQLLFRELARRLTEIDPAMDVGTRQVVALAMGSATPATTVEGADGPRSGGTDFRRRTGTLAAIVALAILAIVVVVGFSAQRGNWLALSALFAAGAAAGVLASHGRTLDSPSKISWLALVLIFLPTAVLTVVLGPAGGGYFVGFVVALVAQWVKNGR